MGRRILLLLLLASFPFGCASNQAVTRRALGTPEARGMAVLRTVLNADYKGSPTFENLKRQMTTGELRLPHSGSLVADIHRAGEKDARGGSPFEGVFVFPNLEPGTYVLRSMEQPREVVEHFEDWQVIANRKEYRLDAQGGDITFEVRSGQPVYIGTLELEVFYDTNVLEDAKRVELEAAQFHASLRRIPADEIDIWNAFLRRAPESPWAPVLKERVEWLRAQPTSFGR